MKAEYFLHVKRKNLIFNLYRFKQSSIFFRFSSLTAWTIEMSDCKAVAMMPAWEKKMKAAQSGEVKKMDLSI